MFGRLPARTQVRYRCPTTPHLVTSEGVAFLLGSAIRRDGETPSTTRRPGADNAAELDAGLLADLIARVNEQAGYHAWQRQVEHAGYCQHPIRLAGRVDHADPTTGEAVTVFDTDQEPDGVLLKACGTRRAARCAPCAEVYRQDAYQLVKAGLAGGKGMPESVSGHPSLFVTFTAPSFGQVHTTREHGGARYPCHPAKLADHCQHGRRRACWARHDANDPVLGEPLCADCYDYQAAVLWNATAPALWKRTTIYIRRALAKLAGLSRGDLRRHVRVSYVKVAEFQRRGVVHYHAVIRLDGRAAGGEAAVVAPPARFTVELLVEAIRQAAGAVSVPLPRAPDLAVAAVRWGKQLDIRTIAATHHDPEDGDHHDRGQGQGGAEWPAARLAGYVAKYATKATETFGTTLDRPIRTVAELEAATQHVPAHVGRLVRACWTLGSRRELAGLGLRKWSHMLGYRGHFTTKSRAYSITFRALRAVRRAWVARQRHGPMVALDRDGYLLPPAGQVSVKAWQYQGRGYATTGDAFLAASMAASAREMRRVAREELTAVA